MAGLKLQLTGAIVVTIALGACGSASRSESAKVANNSPVDNMPVAASPAPSRSVPEEMPQGIKVGKQQTVKFAEGSLPDGWRWIDPGPSGETPHEFKNGSLKMVILTGKDLFAENHSAPRMVKAIRGDFQIETRVKFDPTADYQGAGLLIYSDADNYIRLERSFGGLGEGGSGIRLELRKGSEDSALVTPAEIPTSSSVVELKLTRRLNVISAYWREDESAEWRAIDDVSTDFNQTVLAGIVGCSTASEIAAEFSEIRLSPQPITKPY